MVTHCRFWTRTSLTQHFPDNYYYLQYLTVSHALRCPGVFVMQATVKFRRIMLLEKPHTTPCIAYRHMFYCRCWPYKMHLLQYVENKCDLY